MLAKLQNRLAREEKGFTLIELLVVIIIIGILLAIAIPSYLGFRERANESAARANVRAAIPAVEAYNADNVGAASDSDADATTTGYEGMNLTELQEVDPGVKGVAFGATAPTETNFCIQATVGAAVWSKTGPGGNITEAAC